ncbi:hypothetical protein EDB85DRAFT_520818 [Lactarius pseudohatsudake]|nr:hypothetical protein EDB85DRAFT_520818 [Lactarius pseudohatsudake]
MSFQNGAAVETWLTRSSRTSARVPVQPAVFDAIALSVPTIFDFGPLLKLGAVLAAQVHSLLALLRIFRSGGLDDQHDCQDGHADTTGGYGMCLRPKESAGSPSRSSSTCQLPSSCRLRRHCAHLRPAGVSAVGLFHVTHRQLPFNQSLAKYTK